MTARLPEMVQLSGVEPVQLFDFQQQVLFSPKQRGEGFIKLAVTTGKRGARSTPHAHPRDEVTMTLKGRAVLRSGGQEFIMTEGTAMRLPPGVLHEVEVLSEEWVVIAAYCDECMLCRGPDGGVSA